MKFAFVLIASLAGTLAACSSDAPPPAPATSAAKPAKPMPNSNIFSSDVRALNKAKNVQNIVNKQNKKLKQAIKDSGG